MLVRVFPLLLWVYLGLSLESWTLPYLGFGKKKTNQNYTNTHTKLRICVIEYARCYNKKYLPCVDG